jgi:glycolate oxidase FAD binding subunit
MTDLQPQTVEDVQACVRAHRPGAGPWLRPVAGRTKTALAGDPGGGGIAAQSVTRLDVSALTGILDYQPQECTFTARAATRVTEIEAALAEHGHYLPFDPPFGPGGATLGGTVATALSGPARYRYGGIRDFLLGVRFVDGEGNLVRGGGRVVKNAAGFYLHHLLLGSLGRLAVITEVTCKVFPAPAARATVDVAYPSFATLVGVLARLRRTPFEMESIEIAPPGRLLVRLGGVRAALAARVELLSTFLGDGAASMRVLDADEDAAVWEEARELTWAPTPGPGATLIRIATTPGGLTRLEPRLSSVNPPRRYGVGGEVAWVSWSRPLVELDGILSDLGLAGLTILGPPSVDPHLGVRPDAAFLARVTRTFDPRGVFTGEPALAGPAAAGSAPATSALRGPSRLASLSEKGRG